MSPVRTALYLDFDNVFSGLMNLDPRLALRYAREPSVWVDRLISSLLTSGERRWLVLRCYLNPKGSIKQADGTRVYFDQFRRSFTDAGFEVVDCPRLASTKNGADIRMALDAMEALGADVRYDEFVIASGDSDMTPLLVRLRAADRRTTVVSASDSAVVLESIADRLIGGEELLELLQDAVDEPSVDPLPTSSTSGGAAEEFTVLAKRHYAKAGEAINLAELGIRLRRELDPAIYEGGWLGHSTLKKALQSLALPGLSVSMNYVWDSRRHDPPEEAQSTVAPEETPAPVARVLAVLRLPQLQRSAWRPAFRALAEHVRHEPFEVNETTRWARDQLLTRGVVVGRRALNVIARGSAYGGAPLFREPPPSAEEIGLAFVGNVVDRARKSDVELTDDDVAVIRDWFGASA